MTAKSIEFHEEAGAEYDSAFDWYLERNPDAAIRFDAAVEHGISEILQGLGNGPLVRSIHAGTCSDAFRFFSSIVSYQRTEFRS